MEGEAIEGWSESKGNDVLGVNILDIWRMDVII